MHVPARRMVTVRLDIKPPSQAFVPFIVHVCTVDTRCSLIQGHPDRVCRAQWLMEKLMATNNGVLRSTASAPALPLTSSEINTFK